MQFGRKPRDIVANVLDSHMIGEFELQPSLLRSHLGKVWTPPPYPHPAIDVIVPPLFLSNDGIK